MKKKRYNRLNICKCPPSPRVLCRNYSETKVINHQLHPYFITGFSDGEGYFNISISRSTKMKTGWIVYLQFGIALHKKDRLLLESIKTFFGNVGNITEGNQKVQYRVTSIKDLEVIIEHFDNFPLITQKWSDYQLFKSAFELVKCKKHLTQEGLEKIVSIKASFNWGLSDDLKPAFSHVTPEARPLIQNQEIKDPNWLAGFVSGEGCFMISLRESKTHKLGERVNLRFQITQHFRDAELMKSFETFLGCGTYRERAGKDFGEFIVDSFSDIQQKIISFFDAYPIQGAKSLDSADFKQVAELMKTKAHLTAEGLDQIRQIKAGMNTGRKHS